MENVSKQKFSHVLVMGDFNMKEIDWVNYEATESENHISNIFLEGIKDTFFFQHIKEPTRYREGNIPSLLDLVFTNEENMVNNVKYLPSMGRSDHIVLNFNFNCYTETIFSCFERYNFHKGDYKSCVDVLQEVDWDLVMEGLGVSESWTYFAETLIQLIMNYIPVSKVRSDKGSHNPIVTPQCLEVIREKHKKWKKYLNCKSDENFQQYKNARNKVVSELRKANYSYEKDLATRIKTDSKLFWKHVRAKTKTKASIGALENEVGTITSNEQEIANLLNCYFSSVFEKEPEVDFPTFEDRHFEHPLLDIEITEEKVCKVINALKIDKSQGPDRLHPRLLKEIGPYITGVLKQIFRKSLDEGVLPEDWKLANVTAIFKSGDRKRPENYRPISLTSVVCKLMEKLIRNEIVSHMETRNLFSKFQHGFIAGKSCTTQLLEFMEEITEALDRGDDVDVIYLDFQKAFDKVPHNRLLTKLKGYGIRGKIHVWIRDFLTGRKQRVVVNGANSSWRSVTSGIPQGSILGPILFLIFINDLPEVLSCLVKFYADDAKIYSPIKVVDDEMRLQANIHNAEIWAETWKMFFNAKKCKHMRIGKGQPDHPYTMTSNQVVSNIEQVTSEKDLGITFDRKLLFRDHIAKKSAIANRNLGLIFRSFTYLDKDMFVSLYKSLVRPHLEYATTVWSPMFKKDSVILENVQRRATRMVNTISNLSYEDRLKRLGLPSLEYRRLRADMIEVYKILNGIEKVDVNKFFTITDSNTTRGNDLKLFKKRSRLNIRANVFSNRVTNNWNSLPNYVILAPSLNAFKSRLNKHWHGHVQKFTPFCYIPGEQLISRPRNYRYGPLEVV
ncbi:MAG: reverse transcriptase family protein [Candidatus Thiodiazotropha sp.]